MGTWCGRVGARCTHLHPAADAAARLGLGLVGDAQQVAEEGQHQLQLSVVLQARAGGVGSDRGEGDAGHAAAGVDHALTMAAERRALQVVAQQGRAGQGMA